MILLVNRLTGLFIALALLLSNGTAVAQAMCQHATTEAHTIAKSSSDERAASSATVEEMAERAAAKSGTLADVPTAFGAAVLPSGEAQVRFAMIGQGAWPIAEARALARRVIAPPERPPLH